MSINYYNSYNDYFKYIESDSYEEYVNTVSFYYNKKNICPNCKKLDSISKISEQGILKMKCDKCIWFSNITHPVYVNLHNILQKYKNEAKKLTFLIKNTLENNDDDKTTLTEFNDLKHKYTKYINHHNNIERIFTIQNDTIKNLNNYKFNIYTKLYKLNLKRKNKYSPIDTPDKQMIKEYLITNGFPIKNELNKIIKSTTLNEDDIKNIFKWTEYIKRYMYFQYQLEDTNSEINKLKSSYEKINNNLIIKKHNISKANIKNIMIIPKNKREANTLKTKRDMEIIKEYEQNSDDENDKTNKYPISTKHSLNTKDQTVLLQKINFDDKINLKQKITPEEKDNTNLDISSKQNENNTKEETNLKNIKISANALNSVINTNISKKITNNQSNNQSKIVSNNQSNNQSKIVSNNQSKIVSNNQSKIVTNIIVDKSEEVLGKDNMKKTYMEEPIENAVTLEVKKNIQKMDNRIIRVKKGDRKRVKKNKKVKKKPSK
jgi:Zn ribbon nucleic-acid-binding protein